MPYPNEHAARMNEPGKYDKMRRGNIAPGIDVIYGIKNGKSEIQAYRFDSKKFTAKEAKKWLKEHDKHPIKFEPASGESDNEAFDRNHQVKCFFNIAFVPGAKIESTEDGATIVHDVPIMAEGRWISMQGVDAVFTAEVLEKCSTPDHWKDKGLWLRHPGGQPRPVTDMVGALAHQRYDPKGAHGTAAQMADLYIHCKTPESRSASELVRMQEEMGGIKSISAETLLDLEYNSKLEQYTVTNVVYTGAALVRTGACETCKLPAYEQCGGTDMTKETTKEVKKDLEEEEEEEDSKDDAITGPPQKVGKTKASLEGVMEALKQCNEGVSSLSKFCHEALKAKMEQAPTAQPPDDGKKPGDEDEEEEGKSKVAYESLTKKIAELEAKNKKLSEKTLPATVAAQTSPTQAEPISIRAYMEGHDLIVRRR